MIDQGGGLDKSVSFRCLLTALAVIAAWTLMLAPAPAAVPVDTTDPRIAGAVYEQSPGEVIQGWSDEAMREAVPVETPVPRSAAFDLRQPGEGFVSAATGPFLPGDSTAWPQRVHGKIFFRFGAQEYACSGTVVRSRGRNIVMTAGHCVYDRASSSYADELVFVPGYDGTAPDDQQAPLGTWAAEAVFTTAAWVEQGRLSHDIAAVVLSRQIEGPIGSRRIAFDLDPTGRPYTIYGYPQRPDPFTGDSLIGCRSVALGRDWVQGPPLPLSAGPCPMQDGASGGGWITDGYLNSVTSYVYCDGVPSLCGVVYGPYFTSQAKELYTYPAVGGSASPTVRIASGPRRGIKVRYARFSFTGSGSTPLSYRCKLDRRDYIRCGSRVIARRLSPGRHVLRVRSVDQTGRFSRRTAVRIFRVLRRR